MLNIKRAYPLLEGIKPLTLKNVNLNDLSGRQFLVNINDYPVLPLQERRDILDNLKRYAVNTVVEILKDMLYILYCIVYTNLEKDIILKYMLYILYCACKLEK